MSTTGHLPRPAQQLALVSKAFPGLWKVIEKVREARGTRSVCIHSAEDQLIHHVDFDTSGKSSFRWQDKCFLPAGLIPMIQGLYLGRSKLDAFSDEYHGRPGRWPTHPDAVQAIATWRYTQGIYDIDADLCEALWTTPVTGTLPSALFYHLPEWCTYVRLPSPRPYYLHTDESGDGHAIIHGFYAFLIQSHGDSVRLALVPDCDKDDDFYVQGVWLQLGSMGVLDAIHTACVEDAEYSREHLKGTCTCTEGFSQTLLDHVVSYDKEPDDWVKDMANAMLPLLSLLLYVCSTAAEIRDRTGQKDKPVSPQPVKTKKGTRLFPPAGPTTWEVGYRIGAALRHAEEMQAVSSDVPPDGLTEVTRNGPRPHVRRAHWHLYWTGKKTEDRVPRVLWIHPMLVAAKDVEQLVPTMHAVAS